MKINPHYALQVVSRSLGYKWSYLCHGFTLGCAETILIGGDINYFLKIILSRAIFILEAGMTDIVLTKEDREKLHFYATGILQKGVIEDYTLTNDEITLFSCHAFNDDKVQLTLQAFYERIYIYQNPFYYSEMFNKVLSQRTFDLNAVSRFASSVDVEKLGGLCSVFVEADVCTTFKMKEDFNRYFKIINDSYPFPVIFATSHEDHTTGFVYNPNKKSIFFIESNVYPPIRLCSTTDELIKIITSLFPNYSGHTPILTTAIIPYKLEKEYRLGDKLRALKEKPFISRNLLKDDRALYFLLAKALEMNNSELLIEVIKIIEKRRYFSLEKQNQPFNLIEIAVFSKNKKFVSMLLTLLLNQLDKTGNYFIDGRYALDFSIVNGRDDIASLLIDFPNILFSKNTKPYHVFLESFRNTNMKTFYRALWFCNYKEEIRKEDTSFMVTTPRDTAAILERKVIAEAMDVSFSKKIKENNFIYFQYATSIYRAIAPIYEASDAEKLDKTLTFIRETAEMGLISKEEYRCYMLYKNEGYRFTSLTSILKFSNLDCLKIYFKEMDLALRNGLINQRDYFDFLCESKTYFFTDTPAFEKNSKDKRNYLFDYLKKRLPKDWYEIAFPPHRITIYNKSAFWKQAKAQDNKQPPDLQNTSVNLL